MVGFYDILFIHIYKIYMVGLGFMASCLYIYINIYGMVGFYGILFIHIYKIYMVGLGLWHPVYTYI